MSKLMADGIEKEKKYTIQSERGKMKRHGIPVTRCQSSFDSHFGVFWFMDGKYVMKGRDITVPFFSHTPFFNLLGGCSNITRHERWDAIGWKEWESGLPK